LALEEVGERVKAEVRAKELWADHSGQARAGNACVRSAGIAPPMLPENPVVRRFVRSAAPR